MKRNRKKVVAAVLSAVMLCSMAACGSQSEEASGSGSSVPESLRWKPWRLQHERRNRNEEKAPEAGKRKQEPVNSQLLEYAQSSLIGITISSSTSINAW